MNKLWEEYVFKMLLRQVGDLGDQWIVKGQAHQAFWETKVIKPDIVLTHIATNKQIILDTKWKIVLDGKPFDDDLKQMFAYNIYWNSAGSILLYPKASNNKDAYGIYHKGQTVEHGCKLMFLDVLDDEGKLNREIGVEILEGVDYLE
ncbi:MAG: 5-methylcytosine-specific restriction enzyme subunit McrC [Psychroserpens sp.]|jgi:5-methylcytosine-specific restriction enzyme subunit McrC